MWGLLLNPYVLAASAGAFIWNWVTNRGDDPETVDERSGSRLLWAVALVGAVLGGIWIWKKA